MRIELAIIPVGGELPAMRSADEPPRGRKAATGTKPKRSGAAANRFRVLNTFCDVSLAGLRRNEIAVWLVLWRNVRDGVSRVSQIEIARRIGAHERTARRVLRRLGRLGLVAVVRRGKIGGGASVCRLFPTAKAVRNADKLVSGCNRTI